MRAIYSLFLGEFRGNSLQKDCERLDQRTSRYGVGIKYSCQAPKRSKGLRHVKWGAKEGTFEEVQIDTHRIRETEDRSALTREQVAKIDKWMHEKHPTGYGGQGVVVDTNLQMPIRFWLSVATAMRLGDCLNARWGDLNLDPPGRESNDITPHTPRWHPMREWLLQLWQINCNLAAARSSKISATHTTSSHKPTSVNGR